VDESTPLIFAEELIELKYAVVRVVFDARPFAAAAPA